MGDVVAIVIVGGFFALAVGLVRLCEHIVGDDPTLDGEAGEDLGDAADSRVEVTA